jgi:tetratricopeptide (TPR) repeat protein
LICSVFFLFYRFNGTTLLYEWHILSEFDTIKVQIDNFTQGLLNYSLDAENYFVKERFVGSPLTVKAWLASVYFPVILLYLSLGLAIITRTDLIWFAVGAGIFIFFIFNIHTETLKIFGAENRKFSILAILVFTALAFYFQAYDKKFSFFQRFFIFLSLAFLFFLAIIFGSEVSSPLLYAANYSIIVPVILTIVFILSVAYDIINGFLYITSSGRNYGKNNLYHFIFISLLYLVNLFLIYLKKKGIIKGDFIHVDIFLIFFASAILGIWEHRKRKFIYENLLSGSLASFLYISTGIISLVTIIYCFATGNDAMILAFEYVILYSHLGIGFLFFLYVIYNFGELFGKNVSAYKHVYEPRRFPFLMVRPLGLIIVIALFFQSGKYPLRLVQAGYYNFAGDIYYHTEDFEKAREAYKEGVIYARLNKKSNLSMASALTRLDKKSEAVEYYKNSLERFPTEYAFINLSNIYLQNDKYFYSLFNLRDGLKEFPESGMIHNNTGMVYGIKGIWDSSFYHLNASKNYLKENSTPPANLMWFFARKNFLSEADSLFDKGHHENYLPFAANQLAKSNLQYKRSQLKLNEAFLNDTILNSLTYAYLVNYIVNDLYSADTSILNHISRFTRIEANDSYYHELMFLRCLKLYYSGKRYEAISTLRNLSSTTAPSSAMNQNKILGLWAMQQNASQYAIDFFQKAFDYLNPESQFNKAVALLEAGKDREGIEILLPLSKNPETGFDEVSGNLIKLYNFRKAEDLLKESEEMRAQFIHFRKDILSESELKLIFNSISDLKYRTYALADVISYYTSRKKFSEAEEVYNKFLPQSEENGLREAKGLANFQYLFLLEAMQRWDNLLENTEKLLMPEHKKLFGSYFKGAAYWKKGNINEAGNYLSRAIEESPYQEKAFIYLAELNNFSLNHHKAYDILLKGIELNANSPELHKIYALQALKLNLTNYADLTMKKLKEMISQAEYSQFLQIYKREKALHEKEFEQF